MHSIPATDRPTTTTITYEIMHKAFGDKVHLAGNIGYPLSSILDNISGLGEKRKKELIKKYGSVSKISEASVDELSEILPRNVAINLNTYLKDKMNNK